MSEINWKAWNNYISRLNELSTSAEAEIKEYMLKNISLSKLQDKRYRKKLIDYAYGLVTKYGEGSAALSALMYEATAELEGKFIGAAEVADTASYDEVAKTVNGILKTSNNENILINAVGRLVKQAGADTTLKNAMRDGAEAAWIPIGDTCPFCIALASRGWQTVSKKTLKNGHAEHIHSNCDCQYSVRFSSDGGVSGYDPERYLEQYQDADGSTPTQKINAMRRENYARNREKILAQKRSAYEKRKELNSSKATEENVSR